VYDRMSKTALRDRVNSIEKTAFCLDAFVTVRHTHAQIPRVIRLHEAYLVMLKSF